MGWSPPTFYGEQPTPAEAGARAPALDLEGAASLGGLEQEITLLRALVKRAVHDDQTGEARRLVQALCGALRLQLSLADPAASEKRGQYEALLEEVGREVET